METSLVSIIVPCYNQAQYLTQTVESILCQTYNNWECIIINDGSSDNTAGIAKLCAQKDSRIKYIYQANQGVSSARNNAIRLSTGKYILCIDADDLISNSFVQKMVDVLDSKIDVKVVASKVRLFGKKNKTVRFPKYSLTSLMYRNLFVVTSMFRRIDFENSRGFNENMKFGLEDWDFWLSLLKKGGDVVRLNNILFYYRIKKSSRNKDIDKRKYEVLYETLFENHQDLYSTHYPDYESFKKHANIINSLKYRIIKKLGLNIFLCNHK